MSDTYIPKPKTKQDRPVLTAQEARQLFRHDPQTGELFWRINVGHRAKAGAEAGGRDKDGYRRVKLNYIQYKVHRVCWLLHYGSWPENQIDHVNGIVDDNRIENLRDVTARGNGQNRIEHRNGSLPGSSFIEGVNRWRAYIRIGGKQKHLGYFDTELEAHKAYLEALESLL